MTKFKSRDGLLSTLIYFWLSVIVHLYLFYGAVASPSVQDLLAKLNPSEKKQTKLLQNIILQTAEEAPKPDTADAISDKNAADSSPAFDPSQARAYNFAGKSAVALTGEEESRKEASVKDQGAVKAPSAQAGGLDAPFLYDPDKEPIVNLRMGGGLSIAAEAKDYAAYFIAMQNKIAKFHKEFFPVYQYYQGLIRDGVVVVDFTVDKNGNVVKAEVVSSYGSDSVDAASLNSILYAKNFGPLPSALAQNSPIKIRFHFVYLAR